jgi:hypothetical protein
VRYHEGLREPERHKASAQRRHQGAGWEKRSDASKPGMRMRRVREGTTYDISTEPSSERVQDGRNHEIPNASAS